MIGTALSFIISLLLFVTPMGKTLLLQVEALSTVQAIVATAIILIFSVSFSLFLLALQRAEGGPTPKVASLFRQDRKAHFAASGLLFFGLITYILASFSSLAMRPIPVVSWLIGLGIAIDLLRFLFRRWQSYLDPFWVVQQYAEASDEITAWLDAGSTAALKAVDTGNIALAQASIQSLYRTMSRYLEKKGTAQKVEEQEDIQYILIYFLQRIGDLTQTALEKHVDSITGNILSTLGKTSLVVAKEVSSLTTLPLHQIGSIAMKAVEEDLQDLSIKSTCTLQEVSKAILSEVDLEHTDLRESLICIIHHLEDTAKETFRRDKNTDITLLVRPFQQMQKLLEDKRYADRDDVQIILRDLTRVQGEFAALSQVMTKIQVD